MSTIEEYLESVIVATLTGYAGLVVYNDYAKGYDEFIQEYSRFTPGALIVKDGWGQYNRYDDDSQEWEHYIRIIINVIRAAGVDDDLLDLRDALHGEQVKIGNIYYNITVERGGWLPSDKSKNSFEYNLKCIELC